MKRKNEEETDPRVVAARLIGDCFTLNEIPADIGLTVLQGIYASTCKELGMPLETYKLTLSLAYEQYKGIWEM